MQGAILVFEAKGCERDRDEAHERTELYWDSNESDTHRVSLSEKTCSSERLLQRS